MSETTRPRPTLPWGPQERALTSVGALASLVMLALPYLHWGALPAQVPVHFDATGTVDDTGPRFMVVVLAGMGCMIFGLLAWLSRHPHLFNYPREITSENAAQQYTLARRFVLTVGLELACVFLYLTWTTLRIAQQQTEGLSPVFLGVSGLILFGTFGSYLLNARSR